MFKYLPLGDSAFLIKLGNEISVETNKKIRALSIQISQTGIQGIVELIPAYNELMVCYNPLVINFDLLLEKLKLIENNLHSISLPPAQIIHIPVCYDPDFALDIEFVASTNMLSVDEVKRIHSSSHYLVYMLGFTPGFCYLGGMDSRLTTPRKETPRIKIEAGSVGIAGSQSGIYPIDSPGGWQIIGKTPIKPFDPNRQPEFLIEPGNYIKFNPISTKEFYEIKRLVEKDEYVITREPLDA
ncbi:MAG: allophanate hydrolase [Firmicutes bacterium HGW-Firmicutes-13]|nr:MAG: allophanate hydrolase [Firmicutes bacterium HGW-Firmicutes-13]